MNPASSDRQKGEAMVTPILDDIQGALNHLWPVRLALNTLEGHIMPPLSEIDGVQEMLDLLRATLEEAELAKIRRLGPREYMMIKPLAPDAGGEFAEKAAIHVRALDDLGLIVRLDL
jgi:hypothetical protein